MLERVQAFGSSKLTRAGAESEVEEVLNRALWPDYVL